MPLEIDWENELILITSPTVDVDMQELHDFIEDNMASARGSTHEDILNPEGKIEDPNNPGVYSQIIVVLNSPWQVQFWGGSGYTRIYGGKLVGGLNDEPMKATGTAGDITVLESPVDGLTVVSGSGITQQDKLDIAAEVWARVLASGASAEEVVELLKKLGSNKLELADGTGDNWVLYDDDGITPILRWPVRDKGGNAILSPAGIPARRGKPVTP
jgi:hypothetical protein